MLQTRPPVMATSVSMQLQRKLKMTKVIGVEMHDLVSLLLTSLFRIRGPGIRSCHDWTCLGQTQMTSGERWWRRRKATKMSSLLACKTARVAAHRVASGKKSPVRKMTKSLRSQKRATANQSLSQPLWLLRVRVRVSSLRSLASQRSAHRSAQLMVANKAKLPIMRNKSLISQRMMTSTGILHKTEMVHF